MNGPWNRITISTAAALAFVAASPCAAQAWRADYQWSHVGAPGNRPATAQEAPLMPGIGAVAYEFDIMTTPVTVGQYWEFVQAYIPFYESPGTNTGFTGQWIHISLQGQVFPPQPQWLNYPATPNFEYAARFVNWLHNGKVNEAWAFENGVYDTSTFTENPDGSYNHNTTPAEGATVWIPTLDEYTKAFHYDPNRNGEGEDGYWRYPHMSDEPPIPGLPEDGGETDAGDSDFWNLYQDVGSYPWADSPWGVLDSSGGEREWTTTPNLTGHLSIPDSNRGGGLSWDRLDSVTSWPADSIGLAFRLVTPVPVPVPGASIFLMTAMITITQRRRSG